MIVRTVSTILAAVLLLVQGAVRHSALASPVPTGAGPPADVAAHLRRRSDCNHWSGEDAYDAARDREIAAALGKLNCKAIDADAVRLRRRYRRDPGVLKQLDRGRETDG